MSPRASSPAASSADAAPRGLSLIGFMGSGKSTLGAALAPRLGLPFVDLDRLIEAEAGQSCAEIIRGAGEPNFRRLESQALARVLAGPPVVLACGGGAPMSPGAMDALLSWGDVVHLYAPLATLAERVGEGSARPLWDDAVARRYAERLPTYQRAHLSLDASRPSGALIDLLLAWREDRPCEP